MRIAKLEPRDRLINISMDEVYTAQGVELAGGKYYGETDGALTKTLFCVRINSVSGKYEDMVSMEPVAHVRRDGIADTFNKALQGLTELGFVVISVTTDNHIVNQSWHNSLGADGQHPEYIVNPYSAQEDQRIYTMYDSVHAFKNMCYGLMRTTMMTLPPFPGLDDPRPLKVSFSHLIRMHNMERGDPAKLAYKLTDRVLHPSVLERVDVGLAAAATDQSTSAALRYFAGNKPGCEEFKDTAVFLELFRKWFDSCNVKSPLMWLRMNDRHRVPLRLGCKDSQQAISLCDFGAYMRGLADKGMPRDTCMAVYHTCRGLTGLADTFSLGMLKMWIMFFWESSSQTALKTTSVIYGNCQEETTGFLFDSSSKTRQSSGSKDLYGGPGSPSAILYQPWQTLSCSIIRETKV